jgi:AcrR family transcriptional regulator
MPSDTSTDPRALRTRARVLAGAQELLLHRGIDAVTHLEVARATGVGRRTLYRHWPDRTSLLHDTLATSDHPHAPITGVLRDDVRAHLEALRRALVDGPLAYVVLALNERARVDPELVPLRDRLTEAGCAPLRSLLVGAVERGDLPADTDVDEHLAALEGPLFYRVLVRAERPGTEVVRGIVDRVLPAS